MNLESFFHPWVFLQILFLFNWVFVSKCIYECFACYCYYRNRACLIDLPSDHYDWEEWECLSFLWFRQVRIQSIINILAMWLTPFTQARILTLCCTRVLVVKQHDYSVKKKDSWLCGKSLYLPISSLKSHFITCNSLVQLCIKHFSNGSGEMQPLMKDI